MMMSMVDSEATAVRERWRRMLAALPELPGVPAFLARQLIGERSPQVLLWIGLGFARVKKIFKKIGAEMQADPVMGPNLLDPPKSQGVLEIDDSAMIIRCKFMARPGEQFIIRRELFQRVQQEFEAAGIQFARRQVSVYVPPAVEGEAPDPQATAAAAAEAELAARTRRAAS